MPAPERLPTAADDLADLIVTATSPEALDALRAALVDQEGERRTAALWAPAMARAERQRRELERKANARPRGRQPVDPAAGSSRAARAKQEWFDPGPNQLERLGALADRFCSTVSEQIRAAVAGYVGRTPGRRPVRAVQEVPTAPGPQSQRRMKWAPVRADLEALDVIAAASGVTQAVALRDAVERHLVRQESELGVHN